MKANVVLLFHSTNVEFFDNLLHALDQISPYHSRLQPLINLHNKSFPLHHIIIIVLEFTEGELVRTVGWRRVTKHLKDAKRWAEEHLSLHANPTTFIWDDNND